MKTIISTILALLLFPLAGMAQNITGRVIDAQTGGALPGAVVADAVVRLLPGVIGDEQSALSDSFQDGLLAPPVYSRPAEYNGWRVPDILLSGHEAKIAEWRYEQALERTRRLRPDLLEESNK